MKKVYWLTSLVILFVVLVVRSIPAQWAFAAVNQSVQVSGVSGTLWSGRAATLLIPYNGNVYSLGRVDWLLKPWSLLALNPCALIATELNQQRINADICIGLDGSITLTDTEVALPASTAATFAPPSLEANARGDILIRVDSLEFADNQLQSLTGKGSWSGANVLVNGKWINLGNIGFNATGAVGVINSKLFSVTENGQLKMDLESSFTLADASCKLKGEMAVNPGAPKELANALAVFGSNLGGNKYRIDTDC